MDDASSVLGHPSSPWPRVRKRLTDRHVVGTLQRYKKTQLLSTMFHFSSNNCDLHRINRFRYSPRLLRLLCMCFLLYKYLYEERLPDPISFSSYVFRFPLATYEKSPCPCVHGISFHAHHPHPWDYIGFTVPHIYSGKSPFLL